MDKQKLAIEYLLHNLDPDTQRQNQIFRILNLAFDIERQQLEAAFKAGWMRANATNYDPAYFEHYLNSIEQ